MIKLYVPDDFQYCSIEMFLMQACYDCQVTVLSKVYVSLLVYLSFLISRFPQSTIVFYWKAINAELNTSNDINVD